MLNELAMQVRNGTIDPVDLVKESLRRIDAARELNAVVDLYADEALAIAQTHSRQGANDLKKSRMKQPMTSQLRRCMTVLTKTWSPTSSQDSVK
jgi:Asp-tRNA(Asn)/Glu-tRNA(Gln) amidotransferase A subunit family amidase